MKQPVRIVAVDDHPYILRAVQNDIDKVSHLQMVDTGTAGEDVLPLLLRHRPDVLILDQRMPHYHDDAKHTPFRALPTIKKIRRDFPHIRIIILSMLTDAIIIHQTLNAGAAGFISKSDADVDISVAIQDVLDDKLFLSKQAAEKYTMQAKTHLTTRQLEVLTAIKNNPWADYAALSNDLSITESTFKKHLTQALRKLGTPNDKTAAIKLCAQLGLLG